MTEPLPMTDQDKADLESLAADEGVAVEDLPDISDFDGARRNHPCPCGSGKKYKMCHGSPESQNPIDPEDAAPFVPIIKVWWTVLNSAKTVADESISFQWANKICSQYLGMTFPLMLAFRDRYYSKMFELLDILNEQLAKDDEAFSPTTQEEDIEQNASAYKALLIDWQVRFVEWEQAWDCADPEASAELAACSEVHKFFFADDAFVAYLQNIGFKFSEADQQDLILALQVAQGVVPANPEGEK